MTPRAAGYPRVNPPDFAMAARQTTWAIFQMNNTKLYISIVTLSIHDNMKVLKNIKQGFKK